MKLLDRIALTILILAGIHIALSGLLNIDIIELVFGAAEALGAKIVSGVVGVSALWCLKYFTYTPEGGSRLKGR